MLHIFRSISLCRMFCSTAEAEGATLLFRYRTRPPKKSYAVFLQDIFDCSYDEAYDTINKHPFLMELSQQSIIRAADILKGNKVKGEELRKCPEVLKKVPVTLEHYTRLLRESGFPKVTPSHIMCYRGVVSTKISVLKSCKLLPEDTNVGRNFLSVLEAPDIVVQNVESTLDVNSDDNQIIILRDEILKCYLQWRLEASREEVEHMFSTYARLLNKSLELMRRTLSILLDDLKFPNKHITKNGHIIVAHPDDLMKIMNDVPHLGGKPIRDVLYSCSPLITASHENVMDILKAVKKARIPEEQILQFGSVFNLSGQCVKERLPLLHPRKMTPKMKQFMINERILGILISYDNFAQRVNYLTSQGQSSTLLPVPSLNRLLGSQKSFEKFIKGLSGPSRGSDIVNYLVSAFEKISSHLNVSSKDIKTLLSKNPNWRHVPLSEVRTCLELLCNKGYKPKEILSALPIVLYSSTVVENHLNNLSNQQNIQECFQLDNLLWNDFLSKDSVDSTSVAKGRKKRRVSLIRKYTLPLCLYFLEKDHHFSGDGIWFRSER